MGLFNFLKKKKEDDFNLDMGMGEMPSPDGMSMPPMPDSPDPAGDIYSELPSFPDKSENSGAPVNPEAFGLSSDSDFSVPDLNAPVPPAPAENPEDEFMQNTPKFELPPDIAPPKDAEFAGNDNEKFDFPSELMESIPLKENDLPNLPEQFNNAIPPAPKHHHFKHGLPQLPIKRFTESTEGYNDKIPFIKAQELRNLLNHVHEFQSSAKKLQNVDHIKYINSAETEAYSKWHKSVESLQRKLMSADKLFLKE